MKEVKIDGKIVKLKEEIPAKVFLEMQYNMFANKEEEAGKNMLSLLYLLIEDMDDTISLKSLIKYTQSKDFEAFLAECMGQIIPKK